MTTKETKAGERPRKKDAYDWREGVCKSCGVPARNGCCERHGMNCPACKGFGAISKAAWDVLWKELYERRNNPPNPCCNECTDFFNHSVGSHSDDRDDTPCLCNKDKCAFPFCVCHMTAPSLTH